MENVFSDGPEPAVNEPAATEAEVRPVKELIQAVLKHKRAFEMYPANNPILQKFQEELIRRFDAFFASEERLTLIIRQQDIFHKGVPVYHNPEKDDNMALLFYKDGLREMTFTRGFSGDEALDFIDVIRDRPDTSTDSYDDDMVTRLWEKDFVHLSYYVVEEFVEGSALETDEVARILSQHRTTDGDLAEVYKDAVTEEQGKKSEQIFTPLEKISMGFQGVFTLGEEEVKSLKEEMERLTDANFLQGAINALFESLYLDKGTQDFGILMDNLDSALNYLIHTGSFGTAVLILRRFRELAGQREIFNNSETERINASIRRAGSEANTKAIAEVLNSGRDVSAPDFQLYLSQLDKSSIIPLSNLLGEIQDIKFRKALLDALVTLGRDNIDVLAAAIKDKRAHVIRNAVTVLGRIGDKAALEHLKQALAHTDPNVRREVVRALGIIGGPKAGDALLGALEDPDQQIRMSALRYLPGAQSYAVMDSLMEVITRPDFDGRAFAEKRAFFEILAEIGQDRVLPFMVKLLHKRSLFGSSKNDEIRATAAYGLGNIHQKEALDALNKEVSRAKKGSVLHEAVSYSIHKLARPSGKSPEE